MDMAGRVPKATKPTQLPPEQHGNGHPARGRCCARGRRITLGYWTFRDRMAADVRRGLVAPSINEIHRAAMERGGLGPAQATEWTERFLADVKRHREQRGRAKSQAGRPNRDRN